MQSAFKNILIIEEVSGNKTLAEILFKVPNTTMPIKFNVLLSLNLQRNYLIIN